MNGLYTINTKDFVKNGKKISEEQGVADAHPYGSRPFKRKNYINKFLTLTENILSKKESGRFLKTVQNLKKLITDLDGELIMVPRINVCPGFTDEWIKKCLL